MQQGRRYPIVKIAGQRFGPGPDAPKQEAPEPERGVLRWPEVLEVLGTRGKSYQSFARLVKEGERVGGSRGQGGVVIKLKTVHRPGGRVVRKIDLDKFIRELDAASEREETSIDHGQSEKARLNVRKQTLRLAGGGGGESRETRIGQTLDVTG